MGYDERRAVSARAGIRIHLIGVRPGMIGGALLIVLGTLLFLDNLGILPVNVFDVFWPLILMGFGGYLFYRTCSAAVRIWAIAAFIGGLLLMLDAFHIIRVNGATLWPLGLIAAGTSMLVARLGWTAPGDGITIGSNTSARSQGNQLAEVAVFSQVKRRIETQSFEGGTLASVFGAIELDLRWAGISTPGKVAVVEANAAFGSIELRVPESWRVSMQGNAVFGAYEDKTIPPRPEPGVETSTLVIKGGTAFGAVVIRN